MTRLIRLKPTNNSNKSSNSESNTDNQQSTEFSKLEALLVQSHSANMKNHASSMESNSAMMKSMTKITTRLETLESNNKELKSTNKILSSTVETLKKKIGKAEIKHDKQLVELLDKFNQPENFKSITIIPSDPLALQGTPNPSVWTAPTDDSKLTARIQFSCVKAPHGYKNTVQFTEIINTKNFLKFEKDAINKLVKRFAKLLSIYGGALPTEVISFSPHCLRDGHAFIETSNIDGKEAKDTLFIDKTKLLIFITIIHKSEAFFNLFKARRSGKTFMVCLLKAYFRGDTELYEGTDILLAIQIINKQLENDNEPLISTPITGGVPYPLIDVDFSNLDDGYKKFEKEYEKSGDKCENIPSYTFENSLINKFVSIGETYGVKPEGTEVCTVLLSLLKKLSALRETELVNKRENKVRARANRNVVIIFDEFDYILNKYLNNISNAASKPFFESIKEILVRILTCIKSTEYSENIRLFYFTGIIDWPMVSWGSGFNTPNYLTYNEDVIDAFTFNEEEIISYLSKKFPDIYEQMSRDYKKTPASFTDMIKDLKLGNKFHLPANPTRNRQAVLVLQRFKYLCNGYRMHPGSKISSFMCVDLKGLVISKRITNVWNNTGIFDKISGIMNGFSKIQKMLLFKLIETSGYDIEQLKKPFEDDSDVARLLLYTGYITFTGKSVNVKSVSDDEERVQEVSGIGFPNRKMNFFFEKACNIQIAKEQRNLFGKQSKLKEDMDDDRWTPVFDRVTDFYIHSGQRKDFLVDSVANKDYYDEEGYISDAMKAAAKEKRNDDAVKFSEAQLRGFITCLGNEAYGRANVTPGVVSRMGKIALYIDRTISTVFFAFKLNGGLQAIVTAITQIKIKGYLCKTAENKEEKLFIGAVLDYDSFAAVRNWGGVYVNKFYKPIRFLFAEGILEDEVAALKDAITIGLSLSIGSSARIAAKMTKLREINK